jgi:hypothetical protein
MGRGGGLALHIHTFAGAFGRRDLRGGSGDERNSVSNLV